MKNNIVKYFKGYGFRSVIVLRTLKVFVILFLVTITLITIAYNGIKVSSKKTFLSDNTAELKKGSLIFENFLRESEYLTATTYSDNDVKIFFSLNEGQSLISEQENNLKSILKSHYNTGIKNLYLYNSKNDVVFSSLGVVEKENLEFSFWLSDIKNNYTDSCKIVTQKTKDNYLESLFFIKKVGGDTAYIAVELNISEIKNKFYDFLTDDKVIYVLSNDEIVFTNSTYDGEEWLKELKDSEGYLEDSNFVYGKQDSKYYELSYVVCSSGDEYIKDLKNMYVSFVLIFIGVFVLILIVSVVTSKDSLYYISNLIAILETKKTPEKLKDNEIKYIGDKIIYLMDDNEKLKKEIEMRVTDCASLQNKALQNQITPHFINNSLTVLGNEIAQNYGCTNPSLKMLTKLTRIIKYSYISENVFVTLEEELSFLNDYVDFLQYRYKNFDYVVKCDADTKNTKVLKMILQPFVENAVFYGIKDSGGKVEINITENNDNIEITVFDNGKGMDKETLDRVLFESLDQEFKSEKIGIKNVCRRLKLVYGDNVVMSVNSQKNKFSEFKITVPNELKQ